MWTDSHCHVHEDPDPGAVLVRARQAGVSTAICVGTGYEDSRKAVEKAVRGMLPKNTLGRQMLKKLKVYGGPSHPHAAQKPEPFQLSQVAQ